MDRKNLPGLSPLWLISLALILGTAIVVMIPVAISGGDAIKASDWIGFSGGVVAGAMTLIAAIIAWFAVQQQIRAQELSAERERDQELQTREVQKAEAKFAATIVLTQTVHAAATVLNVAEQALGAADRMFRGGGPVGVGRALEFSDKKQKLRSAMESLKATMDHFAIAQAWQDLGIEDKANYLIVTSTLHTVMTIYENPPRIDDINTIRNQRDALTKLSTYLRAFDTELADVFERDAKL